MTTEDPKAATVAVTDWVETNLGGTLVGIDRLIDVELGHIGDPMMDLAGWRRRDSVIGFGDFSRIYDRFALADPDAGAHDEALLRLFHRRHLRAQMLNGPAGSAMAAHIPLQRFG